MVRGKERELTGIAQHYFTLALLSRELRTGVASVGLSSLRSVERDLAALLFGQRRPITAYRRPQLSRQPRRGQNHS